MARSTFSGRDVLKVLLDHGFVVENRAGSHVKCRYDGAGVDDVRIVSVPMHDEIRIGTLRSIAEQAGANDFETFCAWIAENR